MNKTKIDWADYTWNPIIGCENDCEYCYARKIAHRFNKDFKPTYYIDRLWEPTKIKKPQKIFVCSMGELFSYYNPQWQKFVNDILDVMRECPQHTFFILTKRPEHAVFYKFPDNCFVGVSIAESQYLYRIMQLKEVNAINKFISFEPLLEDLGTIYFDDISWVIIGGQTKPDKTPSIFWVENILMQAREKNIPIFIKENAGWFGTSNISRGYLTGGYIKNVREFPKNIT